MCASSYRCGMVCADLCEMHVHNKALSPVTWAGCRPTASNGISVRHTLKWQFSWGTPNPLFPFLLPSSPCFYAHAWKTRETVPFLATVKLQWGTVSPCRHLRKVWQPDATVEVFMCHSPGVRYWDHAGGHRGGQAPAPAHPLVEDRSRLKWPVAGTA